MMVSAILSESELEISEDVVESIVDKVENIYLYPFGLFP